jgi:hypothetical protein
VEPSSTDAAPANPIGGDFKTMSIDVPISVGELLDKLTILRIKVERIRDPDKAVNVRRELEALEETWAGSEFADHDLTTELEQLRRVNETLWDIEDQIRLKESRLEFDQEFIELARSVYLTNDERAAVTRAINVKVGSDLVGEKSYTEY